MSVYFYFQHTVKVKEYEINKQIDMTGGVMQLDKLFLKNSEKKENVQINFLMNLGLKHYNSTGRFFYNIGYFYSKPYEHNLDYKILKVTGNFISDDNVDKEFFMKVIRNSLKLVINDMNLKPYIISFNTKINSNSFEYEGCFKVLDERYVPNAEKVLNIEIKDGLSDERINIKVKPTWETIYYNFFHKEKSLIIHILHSR